MAAQAVLLLDSVTQGKKYVVEKGYKDNAIDR